MKDGGVTREVEDAVNELQRQMGELERSICEHQKTLDMTSRLQQAMEEVMGLCWRRLSDSAAAAGLKTLKSLYVLFCVTSISSGVRRRAPPSPVWGSFPQSVAAPRPWPCSTGSLRSLCGQRFLSRRRGSVRSQSSLSVCTVRTLPLRTNVPIHGSLVVE